MEKWGRFGRNVDPVTLEKRLKAAREHLSKWGYCRGSEWTDEELADQKLKAAANLNLYGYARGTKLSKTKLKRQKKALGKRGRANLSKWGYCRGSEWTDEELKKQKEALGKRGRANLKLHGYVSGTKVALEEIKRRKKEIGNRCKKNTDAQVAARQATGAYPTTEHVGVSWNNDKDKWEAGFYIRGVDGKKRTHVKCGNYALADVNKAAEAITTKRTALGLPPAGEEVSDEVIRAATKMVEKTKVRRPAGPKSGVTGVTWSSEFKKWVVRVRVRAGVDGKWKREFLGKFKDKKKAIAAVEARREQEGLP